MTGTRVQLLFVEHFPCKECGNEPYHLLRNLKLGVETKIQICEKGLKLLTEVLKEEGLDVKFTPEH